METEKITQWRAAHERAVQRNREYRWNAAGRAQVVHPRYWELVVPHGSNLEAIMNAAEIWGCDWLELLDAEVLLAEPGAVSVGLIGA